MRFAFITTAVLLAGCSGGVRVAGWGTIGGEKAKPVATANPLGGRPLIVEVIGSPDIEVMRPEKCSLWPILDEYQLTADPNRVCVKATLYLMSYESGPLPIDSIELGVSSSARPPTFFRLAAAGMSKVGRCYGTDTMRTGVWAFQFVGCTPNEALLTAHTQSLVLRRKKGIFSGSEGTELAQWTFLDARPAPAAAAAPVARPAAARAGDFVPPPANNTARPAAAAPRPQSRGLYEQGAQLLAQRRYADALEKFSQCLDLEPGLAQGYIARGNSLLALRRYAEAAADYEYALELDARSALPLYGIAEAARGLNDTRKARTYYQRFIDSPSTEATPALKQDVSRKLASLR